MNPIKIAAPRIGLGKAGLNGIVYAGAIACVGGYAHEARLRNKAQTNYASLSIKYERSLLDNKQWKKGFKELTKDRNAWQKKTYQLEKHIFKADQSKLKEISEREAALLVQEGNGEELSVDSIDNYTEGSINRPIGSGRRWGWHDWRP